MSKFRLLLMFCLFLSLNYDVKASDSNVCKIFSGLSWIDKIKFAAALVTGRHEFLPKVTLEEPASPVSSPSSPPILNASSEKSGKMRGFNSIFTDLEHDRKKRNNIGLNGKTYDFSRRSMLPIILEETEAE